MNEATVESHSDLLAYALLDLDPRASCLRQPLLVFLVSLALFERGRPADRAELLEACRGQFLSGDEIRREQIDRVVSASIAAGLLVDAGDGSVDLSDGRREQLREAVKRIDRQRTTFHEELCGSVESKLGEVLIAELAGALEAALDDFVQRLFQEQSVALARMFGPSGKGFDDSTAEHLTVKSLDTLAAAVAPATEKLARAQVAEGIRAGLLDLSAEGQRYLAAVYQRTVASALLQQDPSVRRIKRDLARARIFYLDTNVLMALLFRAHSHHERVLSAVNAARELGCEVVVSTFTVEELEQQLSESDEAYRKLEAQNKAFPIVNDDILRSFACERESNPGIRWRAYHANFHPPMDALADFGIEVREAGTAEAHHDDRRPDVRAAVRSAKPSRAHPNMIDWDTDNLILIQRQRKKAPADAMGNRVWLITLDSKLRVAERRLLEAGVFRVPSAKRISAWIADLSPHMSPDDADLGEYVLHLVQSQLGLLAEDPVFADVNFLATLEESPFNVEELLAAGPEKSRRIIVALQEEQEVRAILQARPERREEQEAWVERFAKAVRDALEKLGQSVDSHEGAGAASRERDQALRREAVVKRERDHSLRRVSELERELHGRGWGLRRWLSRLGLGRRGGG